MSGRLDWKTSQANARRCITDAYEVRAKLSDGSCLSTPYDGKRHPEGTRENGDPDIVCIETTDEDSGNVDLFCIDYDEFTIAGAALLELRDQIIAERDD